MHELSIASAIVESVLAFSEQHQARKIVEVCLSVGELTCVEHEQLRFCYMAITKETEVEDSTLQIETVEAAVQCPHCSYQGRPKYWEDALSFAPIATLQCPKCGNAAEAFAGHDCAIRTIKYVA